MNIAILGTDTEIVQLLAAAISEGHELVWLGDVRTADATQLRPLAPQLQDRADEWELLLDRAVADAVFIGGGDAGSELRSEQIKRLITEAVPVLTVHPISESVLTYYELDMIRRETGAVLQHYNAVASHPVLAELRRWVRDGHPLVGPIHQLTCERRVEDAARATVLAHLARDTELVAAAAGDIRRVSAMGPRAGATSFASLQVQMTSDTPASLRWSVGSRANVGTALETTLVGEQGIVKLRVFDETGTADTEWQLETIAEDQTVQQALAKYDAPLAAVRQFSAAVASAGTERRASASTWGIATRAMEVVDAVALSLEKGRTIDVFQQQLTERLAFRGTMAAIGCGVLLAGFAAVVLVAMIGGFEGVPGQRLVPYWSLALLAVLAFFLVLQIVPLLATKPKRPSPDEPG